jgi:hypothetical protein
MDSRTDVKVTLFGLTPICSISNLVRKEKQLGSMWMEHNAEYSVGTGHAPFSVSRNRSIFSEVLGL